MALVKGPFDLHWGSNTLVDISAVKLNFSQASNNYTTIGNRQYSVDGAITATVSLTFLASDVAALAAVLPQYHVANGDRLSTGELVTGTNGAIDIVAASCTTSPVYNDLDINACGTNAQVFRLKNARTRIESMDFANDAVRTVTVLFIGEPVVGTANIQFFAKNDVGTVS